MNRGCAIKLHAEHSLQIARPSQARDSVIMFISFTSVGNIVITIMIIMSITNIVITTIFLLSLLV